MAQIIYQYNGNSFLRDGPMEAPVPNVGETIERLGQQWIVEGPPMTLNTEDPSGVSIVFVVDLMPSDRLAVEEYDEGEGG